MGSRKARGSYYTPTKVVKKLISHLDIEHIGKIYKSQNVFIRLTDIYVRKKCRIFPTEIHCPLSVTYQCIQLDIIFPYRNFPLQILKKQWFLSE